jgi:DNA-binding NarL/FixJ family response regulator
MNQFYVCIIFIGIMLILVSLGMIAYDRKKGYDNSTKLIDKKEELETIISDADQMINEMNKFSDYIVTQMELKNEEMSTSLKMFEEKYNQLNTRNSQSNMESTVVQPMAVNANSVISQVNKIQHKINEKVVPINNKYKRVIQLSEKGISNTEIAKSLNMGKGEVQLILEMNK